jgi:competence protein ComEA
VETSSAKLETEPQPGPVGQPASDRNVPADPKRPDNPVRTSPLPLRLRDQVLFAVACFAAVLAMAAYYVRTSRWGAEPIELDRQPARVLDYQIDLNSANWIQWSQLPGIGPVLAQRIVEEREQNGPYESIDDLERVKGIGPKRLAEMRPFIRTSPPP